MHLQVNLFEQLEQNQHRHGSDRQQILKLDEELLVPRITEQIYN